MANPFDGEKFGSELSRLVREFVDREIAKLRADIDLRLQTIENAGATAYQGTYDPDRQYSKGQFVTHNGSLWHANELTRARPGDGPDWTLAVKRGRDSRDTR
jgi:hypothetical protein